MVVFPSVWGVRDGGRVLGAGGCEFREPGSSGDHE